jgi:hypothetical protein
MSVATCVLSAVMVPTKCQYLWCFLETVKKKLMSKRSVWFSKLLDNLLFKYLSLLSQKKKIMERKWIKQCFFFCPNSIANSSVCLKVVSLTVDGLVVSSRAITNSYLNLWGQLMVAEWLRYCATNRKVAGSIPDGVIGIFYWHNPSDRIMALGSTQPLTEMSTRSISWG